MVKKKKKKLRVKALIILIFMVYVIFQVGAYIVNLNVDNVNITGNTYLSDSYILKVSEIKKETKFLLLSSKHIENILLDNEFIKSAKVHKKFLKDVEISIVENKKLFFYSYIDKIILEGNKESVYNENFKELPNLINYTPSNILENFCNKLSLIDQNLINKISEIEYSPSIKDNVVLDDSRFIFKMKDGNIVHVNVINLEKFANYDKILGIESRKGVLYLDSSNTGNIFDIN